MKMIYFLFTLFLLISCKKSKEPIDELLCSKKSANISGALRINGYYYSPFGNVPSSDIRIFYNDGTMVYAGAVSDENISVTESRFINGEFYNHIKDSKLFWGIYNITGTTIKFEAWYPSTNKLYVYVREGNILNDSTFVINRSYRCDGSEESSKNEVYHFKQFSPKPDSTNAYTN